MKSRQICGLIAALTILTTATVMPLLIGLPISAHAQNTTATAPLSESQSTNPAQIKDYLTEAIKSLDSGNTTRALEQVDLAGDQLETLAGALFLTMKGKRGEKCKRDQEKTWMSQETLIITTTRKIRPSD